MIMLLLVSLNNWNCKKEDNLTNLSNKSEVLMDLKLNNQWTYRATILNADGIVVQTDTVFFSITRDTIIQNEKWYKMSFGFIGGESFDSFEWFTNKNDGLWYLSKYPGELNHQIALFAKYPANVNDTWFGYDSCTAKVDSKDVEIVVPSGKYNCLEYSYSDKNTLYVRVIRYFSVGKGWIRDEYYALNSKGQMFLEYKRELLGNTLNKCIGSLNSKPNIIGEKHHRINIE